MKILLVYPDFMKGAQGKYYEGIAMLSAVLKAAGHRVDLWQMVRKTTALEFVKTLTEKYPDTGLLAFSSTTNAFSYVADYAQALRRKKEVLTICGGAHPTLSPEEAIASQGIDIICRGEGEYPLLELCNRLDRKEDVSNIPNLWLKRDGTLVKNAPRPLIDNLDELPFPDRDIFDYPHSVDRRWGRMVFMASRGCPFDCAHCCNAALRSVYSPGSAYLRYKSPGRVLAEIKAALRQYPEVGHIIFHDDILPFNRRWFKDFIFLYQREIGLPYVCNLRFEFIDEELVDILKGTGCSGIKVGLESGNDFIRKEVLGRKQDREKIIRAGELCRKERIAFSTFNMVGLPGENLKRCLDTVKLNAALSPLDLQVSVFYPYPKTPLYRLSKEQGFLTDRTLASYGERDTVLKMPDFSSADIIFAYDNFSAFVEYYSFVFMFKQKISRLCSSCLDYLWMHRRFYYLLLPGLWLLRYAYKIMLRIRRKIDG